MQAVHLRQNEGTKSGSFSLLKQTVFFGAFNYFHDHRPDFLYQVTCSCTAKLQGMLVSERKMHRVSCDSFAMSEGLDTVVGGGTVSHFSASWAHSLQKCVAPLLARCTVSSCWLTTAPLRQTLTACGVCMILKQMVGVSGLYGTDKF